MQSPFASVKDPPTFHKIPMKVYPLDTLPNTITSRIAPHNRRRFEYSVSLVLHEEKQPSSHPLDLVWGRLPICLTKEDFEFLQPKEHENMVTVWLQLVFAAAEYIKGIKN